MNADIMRMILMASGDSSQSAMLPLLMMQQGNAPSGDTEEEGAGDNNRQMLDVLVYNPLAERTLVNYADKIQRMNETQKARMYAALVLSLLGSTETGELGAAMKISAHTQLNELFGDPMSGAYSAQAAPAIYEQRKDVPIGGSVLGAARKPPSETVQDIDISSLSSNAPGTKKVTMRNKPKNLIVV